MTSGRPAVLAVRPPPCAALHPGERAAVAFASLTVTVSVLPIFLTAALAPRMGVANAFGGVGIGAASTIFWICGPAVAPRLGRHVERMTPAPTLRLAGAISGAVLIGIAVAPMFEFLLEALTLAGAANGMAQLSANGVLAQSLRLNRQGLSFGIKHASIPAAALLAGAVVPLAEQQVSWQLIFASSGVLALAVAAFAPHQYTRPAPAKEIPDAKIPVADQRFITRLDGAAALGSAAASAVAAFGVASLVAAGFTPAWAGLFQVAGGLAGIVSRVYLGWWTAGFAPIV